MFFRIWWPFYKSIFVCHILEKSKRLSSQNSWNKVTGVHSPPQTRAGPGRNLIVNSSLAPNKLSGLTSSLLCILRDSSSWRLASPWLNFNRFVTLFIPFVVFILNNGLSHSNNILLINKYNSWGFIDLHTFPIIGVYNCSNGVYFNDRRLKIIRQKLFHSGHRDNHKHCCHLLRLRLIQSRRNRYILHHFLSKTWANTSSRVIGYASYCSFLQTSF